MHRARLLPRKTIDAFGGGANMPMTISFRVEDYLAAGVEKQIFEPVFLPKNQMEEAIPASLIEMTVGDITREIWIQRGESPDGSSFKRVAFGDRLFEIAYDVDRRPLGFDLKLDKFEVGFEPGTEQATKFVSNVRLIDPAEGIRDKAHTISMNDPMTHRGFTFYQMRYSAHSGSPHGPAHRAVSVGFPGGSRSGPPDQVRRMHHPRDGHFHAVLHEGRCLHRRRQEERERAARKDPAAIASMKDPGRCPRTIGSDRSFRTETGFPPASRISEVKSSSYL